MINEIEKEIKKDLYTKQEKKLYFKLKLKCKLDKSYMVALREYLRTKDINESIYNDDEILYALIKGRRERSVWDNWNYVNTIIWNFTCFNSTCINN